jgi:hypothetical protein
MPPTKNLPKGHLQSLRKAVFYICPKTAMKKAWTDEPTFGSAIVQMRDNAPNDQKHIQLTIWQGTVWPIITPARGLI